MDCIKKEETIGENEVLDMILRDSGWSFDERIGFALLNLKTDLGEAQVTEIPMDLFDKFRVGDVRPFVKMSIRSNPCRLAMIVARCYGLVKDGSENTYTKIRR